MICEILFDGIFDFLSNEHSYAIETKAKRLQIKTQSAQKRVLDNYCLINSWNL